ncbi:MAG: type 1 glutamine amidotransferase, partial [Pseudomonadota bacterium]
MLIGILLTGHAPDAVRTERGDLDALFRDLLSGHGFDFRTWAVVDMDFPDGPEAADGWLITGSKFGVYDDVAFIAPLEDLIRRIAADRKPLVGVCFGHQIITQALGGVVEKWGGGWSLGRTTYRFADGYLAAHAWHQDQVVEPAPGATVLAEAQGCPYAALAYGDRIMTVQPHPEFGRAEIEALIQARAGIVST